MTEARFLKKLLSYQDSALRSPQLSAEALPKFTKSLAIQTLNAILYHGNY